ncbi:hypothetical protein ACFL5O_02110 [Myxococcota bacterium]
MLEAIVASGRTDSFAHYALAMEYRKLGRTREALDGFAQLRKRDPDYLPTYQMAAQLLAELERSDEARPWLEAGIDLARRVGNVKTASELEQALDGLS